MSKFSVVHEDLFANLPETWNYGAFSEYVDFQEGPGILAKDFHPEGVPLLRLKSIEAPTATTIGCNFLDPQKVDKKWSHFRLSVGDLLLSSSASLGRVSEVGTETAGAIAYTGIIRMRPATKTITKGFIRYFLQSRLFSQQIDRSATGSVINHFGPMHLKQMGITLPPLDEQKAIAHILGTLDDKIEINQKMNQTLEDIAKAIFKSWFVDFDPVRAKVEGRPTGLPDEISNLFPDGLVDSENGEIPTGWAVNRVRDFADAELGGTPSRKNPDFWGGDIPWINSGAVNEFRILEPSELITQQGFKKSSTKLLPEKTTVIAITGATLGQVSYLEIETCANQSVVGVIAHSDCAHEWVYLMFVTHIERLINRQTGGAQQHINKNDVLDFDVIYPTEKIISSFSEIASPLFKRIGVAVRENLVLSELRDMLLPKLISGELRIPDAEKFLGEAGI